MHPEAKARDLFIVDNSVSGWTGLRYLEEWTGIARAFDIATGYFEVGALLALEGKWQGLEKIRILMGSDTTHRTRRILLDAVRSKAVRVLDDSLEGSKRENPFLKGVPGILQALESGQIEVRVYDKDKFHAKAYITHAKLEVVGSQALVGSTMPTSNHFDCRTVGCAIRTSPSLTMPRASPSTGSIWGCWAIRRTESGGKGSGRSMRRRGSRDGRTAAGTTEPSSKRAMTNMGG
jgi:hypothetical protein